MNNLTDYELLQHRHLSLLRALQDKGVICVMEGREWKVSMPVKCKLPCPECWFGVSHYSLELDSNGFVTGAVVQRDEQKHILHLEIDGNDYLTGNTIDKWLVNRPMTPTIRHLLDALQAAIMEPAPAKA